VLVAVLAAAAAVAVWRTVPPGVKPPPLSLRGWGRVLTRPALMGLVLITVLSGAGQFTVFSYMAPYYRQVLGADAGTVSLLFMGYGVFGVVGNVLLTRWIDRLGPALCVNLGLAAILLAMLGWPLAASVLAMAVVIVPWGLGTFSSNSGQQARLATAEPASAPALLALNTSAIYAGQAIGAAAGGAIIATTGFGGLSWVGVAFMAAAIGLSLLLTKPRHG
jgi:MFS transporter, DHA1 family, inner membrane transport protein